MIDFDKLQEPFAPQDIEWMLTPGSVSKKGGTITARCLAYVTARAIQERLDLVCGPAGWRNEFAPGPSGGNLCGISVRVPAKTFGDVDGFTWLTKWDGADNTDIEPVKGGLSGAMKRAGAQWGIGRYLYYLPDGWATVQPSGRFWWGGQAKAKGKDKEYVTFRWDPPALPAWALPGGSGRPPAEMINAATGEVQNSQMACPWCESPVWDHRADKAKGKAGFGDRKPDLACSNAKCTDPNTDKPWAVWLDTWQNDLLVEIEAAHKAETIDAMQRATSEEIVHSGAVEMMVRIQARLNALAEEGA